jgi:WD40 repeat protein
MKKTRFSKIALLLSILLIIFFVTIQREKIFIPRLKIERSSSKIAEATAFTDTQAVLTTANVQLLSEIVREPISKLNSEVIAISEDPDNQSIMAIDTQGTFFRWQIIPQSILQKFNFYSAYRGSTNFSADGSRLIAGGGAVWNTTDGTIIYCPAQCEDLSLLYEEAFSTLNPSGTWMITSGIIDISSVDKDTSHGTIAYLHNDCSTSEPEESVPGVEAIAIDLSDTYFAYVLTNGVVCVEEFNYILGYDVKTGDKLSTNMSGSEQLQYFVKKETDVWDIEFDPTKRWLAVLTDNELAILNLQNFLFPNRMKISLKNGNTISFDKSGDLLALGTKEGIVVYNANSGKQIAEFHIGDVSALYFTRDNRMLVWGDTKGNLHLWGVPNQ